MVINEDVRRLSGGHTLLSSTQRHKAAGKNSSVTRLSGTDMKRTDASTSIRTIKYDEKPFMILETESELKQQHNKVIY